MDIQQYKPNYEPLTLIIDGAHALRRSMYQPNLRELSTSQGVPSGGIYGFFNSLNASINSMSANNVIVIWEGGHSERRKAVYPEYKDRGEHKEEVDDYGMTDYEYYRHQLSWIQKILSCLGIHQVSVQGKEGDDTLFQVCRMLRGQKVIISEDRDFFSLINESTSQFRPIKKEYVDIHNFQSITNCATPKHFLYAKVLLGDGSDNITAVAKGVGEGTVNSVLEKIPENELSPSSIIKVASTFTASRFKKLVDAGEAMINRNLDLIDISREVFNVFELKSIQDNLEQDLSTDIPTAVKIFGALEFNPNTIDMIIKGLSRMASFSTKGLVNEDYIKSIMMGETSSLQG